MDSAFKYLDISPGVAIDTIKVNRDNGRGRSGERNNRNQEL